MSVARSAGGERAHQQHGLLDAAVAQRHGLVQLDDREAGDLGQWLEQAGDGGDAEAVAVVLDDGEDRPLAGDARHFADVVGEVGGVDLDPGIEGLGGCAGLAGLCVESARQQDEAAASVEAPRNARRFTRGV